MEPQQEANALRYVLVVRPPPPYYKRHKVIIRHYEDGEVKIWIDGPSLVKVKER